MMRALKWLGIAVLIPILLFCLLAVLLYLPPVQNWAVKQVAAIASEKTGMEISVEHVNLEFPLNLGVEGVRVIRPQKGASDGNTHQKDTVADIRKMVVDVQLKPLFKGQVEVDKLDLESVKVNTTDFISDTQVKGTLGKLSLESHGIDLKGESLRVNRAQLEDAHSLMDADCNPNKPLEIVFDWGSSGSFMEVAQESNYDWNTRQDISQKYPGRVVDNTINEFFVHNDESDTMVNALVDKFIHYYRFHVNKMVDFYRDRYGDHRSASSKRTYNEIAIRRLESSGWTVRQFTHRGIEPPQHDKYLLWGFILSEKDERYPIKWFNASKC